MYTPSYMAPVFEPVWPSQSKGNTICFILTTQQIQILRSFDTRNIFPRRDLFIKAKGNFFYDLVSCWWHVSTPLKTYRCFVLLLQNMLYPAQLAHWKELLLFHRFYAHSSQLRHHCLQNVEHLHIDILNFFSTYSKNWMVKSRYP